MLPPTTLEPRQRLSSAGGGPVAGGRRDGTTRVVVRAPLSQASRPATSAAVGRLLWRASRHRVSSSRHSGGRSAGTSGSAVSRAQRGLDGRPVEGVLAGQAAQQQQPEGVDVDGRGDLLERDLLGSEVVDRAEHGPGPGVPGLVAHELGDPEVGELDPPVPAEQDVAGLDVAVHDSLGVRVGQGRRDLGTDLGDADRVHRRLQGRGQGGAVDELHDQVGMAGGIVPPSRRVTRPGCDNRARVRVSARNRERSPSLSVVSRRSLTATCRSRTRSVARTTSAIPPLPSSRSEAVAVGDDGGGRDLAGPLGEERPMSVAWVASMCVIGRVSARPIAAVGTCSLTFSDTPFRYPLVTP